MDMLNQTSGNEAPIPEQKPQVKVTDSEVPRPEPKHETIPADNESSVSPFTKFESDETSVPAQEPLAQGASNDVQVPKSKTPTEGTSQEVSTPVQTLLAETTNNAVTVPGSQPFPKLPPRQPPSSTKSTLTASITQGPAQGYTLASSEPDTDTDSYAYKHKGAHLAMMTDDVSGALELGYQLLLPDDVPFAILAHAALIVASCDKSPSNMHLYNKALGIVISVNATHEDEVPFLYKKVELKIQQRNRVQSVFSTNRSTQSRGTWQDQRGRQPQDRVETDQQELSDLNDRSIGIRLRKMDRAQLDGGRDESAEETAEQHREPQSEDTSETSNKASRKPDRGCCFIN